MKVTISFPLEQELLQAAVAAAEEDGVSVDEWIADAIADQFDDDDDGDDGEDDGEDEEAGDEGQAAADEEE